MIATSTPFTCPVPASSQPEPTAEDRAAGRVYPVKPAEPWLGDRWRLLTAAEVVALLNAGSPVVYSAPCVPLIYGRWAALARRVAPPPCEASAREVAEVVRSLAADARERGLELGEHASSAVAVLPGVASVEVETVHSARMLRVRFASGRVVTVACGPSHVAGFASRLPN